MIYDKGEDDDAAADGKPSVRGAVYPIVLQLSSSDVWRAPEMLELLREMSFIPVKTLRFTQISRN